MAFSPDGKTLAIKTGTSRCTCIDAATGKETGPARYSGANPSTHHRLLAFSPDGKRVVVAAADGKALHLLDVAAGEVVRTLPHADVVFAAAFSPDGKHLVGGGYDVESGVYFARLWEADTGKEVAPARVRQVAASGASPSRPTARPSPSAATTASRPW